MYIHIKRK